MPVLSIPKVASRLLNRGGNQTGIMRIALLWICISLPLLAQNTLQHRIAEHAMAASGRVGVACSPPGVKLDRNLNAAVKLPMQSVYKLPIAMAILDAAENGT
jgi:beta-lactamase class A